MATPIEKKLTQLKAFLGDEAAKSALEKAEERESAAKTAGVEVKERKTAKVAHKDEEAEPLTLSDVLSDLEDAIQAGQVTDDLGLFTEPQEGGEEDDEEVDVEALSKELSEFVETTVKETVKESLAEFKNEIKTLLAGYVPMGEASKARRQSLEEEVKTQTKTLADLQAQLNELNGYQPRRKERNRGFRASEDASTVKTGGLPLVGEKETQENPIDAFIEQLFEPAD